MMVMVRETAAFFGFSCVFWGGGLKKEVRGVNKGDFTGWEEGVFLVYISNLNGASSSSGHWREERGPGEQLTFRLKGEEWVTVVEPKLRPAMRSESGWVELVYLL